MYNMLGNNSYRKIHVVIYGNHGYYYHDNFMMTIYVPAVSKNA